jgi:cytochrome c oxidase subunit 2
LARDATTRGDYYDVFDVYLPVALAVFVLVCGAIALAVWRGRRRTAEPSRRNNNMLLEGAYATVLVLITAALLVLTLRVHQRIVNAVANGPAERVNVVAAKWHWRFEYPRYGIVEQGTDDRMAELVVPRDTPIDFRGRSLDVIHGFWVPQVRFQRELFNDRVTPWRLEFGRNDMGGSAPCSFYCGLGHRTMRFRVTVLEPPAFRRWVARRLARERRA